MTSRSAVASMPVRRVGEGEDSGGVRCGISRDPDTSGAGDNTSRGGNADGGVTNSAL